MVRVITYQTRTKWALKVLWSQISKWIPLDRWKRNLLWKNRHCTRTREIQPSSKRWTKVNLVLIKIRSDILLGAQTRSLALNSSSMCKEWKSSNLPNTQCWVKMYPLPTNSLCQIWHKLPKMKPRMRRLLKETWKDWWKSPTSSKFSWTLLSPAFNRSMRLSTNLFQIYCQCKMLEALVLKSSVGSEV